jgi:tungstate transport system substrate-binding protein
MRRHGVMLMSALLLVLTSCSGSSEARVVMGAGTTLVDSLLIAEIVDAYAEVEPTTRVSVVALSSSEAIALAEAGNADVIITHNHDALATYLDEHPQSETFELFSSTFFVVTPPSITLNVNSIEDALTVIAENSFPFVSRDDGSGTHASELAAWDRAGIDPSDAPWYIRTGTGMGATLQVADQRDGATLAEHGAFLAAQSSLTLTRVENTVIPNPYDLSVVDPSGNAAAAAFAEWITSAEGVAVIKQANDRLFGEQVYAAP